MGSKGGEHRDGGRGLLQYGMFSLGARKAEKRDVGYWWSQEVGVLNLVSLPP
jgi:hypothetical protein